MEVLAYHTQTLDRLLHAAVPEPHELDAVIQNCGPSSREVWEGGSEVLGYSWLPNQLRLETSLGSRWLSVRPHHINSIPTQLDSYSRALTSE